MTEREFYEALSKTPGPWVKAGRLRNKCGDCPITAVAKLLGKGEFLPKAAHIAAQEIGLEGWFAGNVIFAADYIARFSRDIRSNLIAALP